MPCLLSQHLGTQLLKLSSPSQTAHDRSNFQSLSKSPTCSELSLSGSDIRLFSLLLITHRHAKVISQSQSSLSQFLLPYRAVSPLSPKFQALTPQSLSRMANPPQIPGSVPNLYQKAKLQYPHNTFLILSASLNHEANR